MDNREINPQREIERRKWEKPFLYAFLGVLAGAFFYFFIEPALFSLITPERIKAERKALERVVNDLSVEKIKLNYAVRERYIKFSNEILEDLDRLYPPRPSLGDISRSKYNKALAFLIYFLTIVLSFAPLLLLYRYYQKRIKPLVFQEPYIEPPLDLGEFKERINFQQAGIDKEKFKALFKSDEDYETFWRIINHNIVFEEKPYLKVGAEWIREHLNVSKKEEFGIAPKVDLKRVFLGGLLPYEELYRKTFPVKGVKVKKIQISLKGIDLSQYRKALWEFKQLIDSGKILFIGAFRRKKKLALTFPKVRKIERLDKPYWVLLAKFGAWNDEQISEEIKDILDKLEWWAKVNGIPIDREKMRATIGLYLIVALAQMFIKSNNIPFGLVNRFIQDGATKYVLSHLSRGMLIKPFDKATEEARNYMLLYHSFKTPYEYWGLSIAEYLNLKYNLIFDVLNEDLAKEIKRKIKIYENYSLWK